MEKLQVFKNSEFGEIRVIEKDGVPWFVGKDVAEKMGYSNPRKAIIDHVDEQDKGVTKCDTLGGKQSLQVINESGLYSLVLSSKLPTAQKFKHWVTSEVLPAIRKNGKYETVSSVPVDRSLKTFYGKPVIFKSDIANYFKVPAYRIQCALEAKKSGCVRGRDFIALDGMLFAQFKAENKEHYINPNISNVIVILESGLKKICRYLHFEIVKMTDIIPTKEVLPATPPRVAVLPAKCEMRTDVPDNAKIQECLARIDSQINAFQELVRLYNRYNTSDKQKGIIVALDSIAGDFFVSVSKLVKIEYGYKEIRI